MGESSSGGYKGRGESDFPQGLIDVRPIVQGLYYEGKWDSSIFDKSVAIVGSRKMSPYGKQVISEIVPKLVADGFTTVSGYMYGVDMEVHRMTYLSGGRTIAVLGWGIDYKNDIQNDDLYYKLIDSDSLFISEYAGEFAPNIATFPQRNRIVAGIASEVIVVEGAKRSGSLITARLAYEMGKTLWAVPGPINSRVSEGTNELIKRRKAKMLTLDELNIYSGKRRKNSDKRKLDDIESKIVDHISRSGGISMSEISSVMGVEVGKLGAILTDLEMSGIVVERGGRYYQS